LYDDYEILSTAFKTMLSSLFVKSKFSGHGSDK